MDPGEIKVKMINNFKPEIVGGDAVDTATYD